MKPDRIESKYQPPRIDIMDYVSQSVICNSPQPGQIEEVSYEDWNIYS